MLLSSSSFSYNFHVAHVDAACSERLLLRHVRVMMQVVLMPVLLLLLLLMPAYVSQAIKAFIRSPDIFQCDFWELPAVQQLSKDAASAPLLQLLNVVLLGDLQGETENSTPQVPVVRSGVLV